MSDKSTLEALLRKLEWAGQSGCPACKALAPFKFRNHKNETIKGGGKHEVWCPLDAQLKALKDQTS